MALLFLAAIFLGILIVLTGLTIGLTLLLHLIFPAVQLGIMLVVGLLVVGLSLHFTGRLLELLSVIWADESEEVDADEPHIVSRLVPPRPRARRKR